MLVNGKELNFDNVRDWSKKDLKEFINSLKRIDGKQAIILRKLCANEINRQNEVKRVNERYEKNKKFIIKVNGGPYFEN